jgi:hypothetical protein
MNTKRRLNKAKNCNKRTENAEKKKDIWNYRVKPDTSMLQLVGYLIGVLKKTPPYVKAISTVCM